MFASFNNKINRFSFFTATVFTINDADKNNVEIKDQKNAEKQLINVKNIIEQIKYYRDSILKLPQGDEATQKIANDKINLFTDLVSELDEELNKFSTSEIDSPYTGNYNYATLEYFFRMIKTIINKYDTLENRKMLDIMRDEKLNFIQSVTGSFAISTAVSIGLTPPAFLLGLYGTRALLNIGLRMGYINKPIDAPEYFDNNPSSYSSQLFKLLKEEINTKYLYFSVRVKEQEKIQPPKEEQLYHYSLNI